MQYWQLFMLCIGFGVLLGFIARRGAEDTRFLFAAIGLVGAPALIFVAAGLGWAKLPNNMVKIVLCGVAAFLASLLVSQIMQPVERDDQDDDTLVD